MGRHLAQSFDGLYGMSEGSRAYGGDEANSGFKEPGPISAPVRDLVLTF